MSKPWELHRTTERSPAVPTSQMGEYRKAALYAPFSLWRNVLNTTEITEVLAQISSI